VRLLSDKERKPDCKFKRKRVASWPPNMKDLVLLGGKNEELQREEEERTKKANNKNQAKRRLMGHIVMGTSSFFFCEEERSKKAPNSRMNERKGAGKKVFRVFTLTKRNELHNIHRTEEGDVSNSKTPRDRRTRWGDKKFSGGKAKKKNVRDTITREQNRNFNFQMETVN